MTYNVKQLLAMKPEELDNIFKAAESGPIPDGPAKGTAIFSLGHLTPHQVSEVVQVFVWKGKKFDAKKGVLVNEISALSLNAILAEVSYGLSNLDGKKCIVIDYSKTSVVAHWVRDEIRLISPGLYLGLVWWEEKRLIHFTLEIPVPA